MAPIAVSPQQTSVAPFASPEVLAKPQPPSRRLPWAVLLTLVGNLLVMLPILKYAQLHEYIQSSPRLQASFLQLGNGLDAYFEPVKIACFAAIACHTLSLLHPIFSYFCRRFVQPCGISSTSTIRRLRHHRVFAFISNWNSRASAFASLHSSEIIQLRVLFEVLQQVFQANKMSRLVAAVWLNSLMVAVIVLNCWLLPFAHWRMHQSEDLSRRAVRLVVDTALDLIYCIGIPSIILLRYVSIFDVKEASFPLDYYAMDAWSQVAAAELRQVFVTSWADLVSKISPWFFLCYRLHALRRLLVPTASPRSTQPSPTRLSFLLNGVLTVVGLGILVIYCQAQWLAATSPVQGCLVELRPWFGTSYTCSVVELSCSQRGIAGLEPEIDAALGEITTDSVRGLVISHCPQFTMPPSIRSFPFLAMIKFYNSTVTSWRHDAQLTATTTPYLQQLVAVETNFTGFPAALEAPGMPESLADIKFIATNLSELPLSLAKAWRSVIYFTMELSPNLREAPSVLGLLPRLAMLSLGSNNLTVTSGLGFESSGIVALGLTNNPGVSTLPASLSRNIFRLSIKKTNVAAIPKAWLAPTSSEQLPTVSINAVSTQLCDELLHTASSSPTEAFQRGRFTISCDDAANIFPDVTYPLDLERSWRAVNRI